MEAVIFLVIFALVYVFSRIVVDRYFKNRPTAWKKTDPLLGVVKPLTKSQKKKEQ